MKSIVRHAFREVVRADITKEKYRLFDALKDSNGKIRCPVTGDLIGKIDVHADHGTQKSFAMLLDIFFTEKGYSMDVPPRIKTSRDNSSIYELVSKQLINDWRKWHHTHATLTLVSKRKNLSDAAKNRFVISKQQKPYTFDLKDQLA